MSGSYRRVDLDPGLEREAALARGGGRQRGALGVGQVADDPFPQLGMPTGIAMSTTQGFGSQLALAPTQQIICDDLVRGEHITELPAVCNLQLWTESVLLVNGVQTYLHEDGHRGDNPHKLIGWQALMQAMLEAWAEQQQKLGKKMAFALWGNPAHAVGADIASAGFQGQQRDVSCNRGAHDTRRSRAADHG